MGNRILIIGAGIGGLALAQGLVKAGFNVTVFERDKSPTSRLQGYRISIRSLGMNALNAILTPEKLNRLSMAKVANIGDGYTCVVSPKPIDWITSIGEYERQMVSRARIAVQESENAAEYFRNLHS